MLKANRGSPLQPLSHQEKFPGSKAMADSAHAPLWKAQRHAVRIRKQNTLWHIGSPNNNAELEVSAFEQKYFQENPTADFMVVHNISRKLS